MLTGEELAQRRQDIEAAPDLIALLRRLTERAQPVLDRMPPIPRWKAMLTADGGMCPVDRSRLEFNPWNPTEHRCPRCHKSYGGERHDRAWAHYQHLWLAERAAHLATVAVLTDHEAAGQRANQLLQAYRDYLDFPNQDNVLGPSRPFFSTYLESIWITDYLAAAMLLRESGRLTDESGEVVSTVADAAANLIGEFDEGLSNRQTWHNAALASIAVWFEDEELAGRAIEGATGVVSHLMNGFGTDGMWYEGDNYHLFALRGQLLAMRWARQAGVDLLADPRLTDRVAAALRAPATTALPDFTFPARKDSRFGVSLAQPMYLELWEIGLARLDPSGERHGELWSWLTQLYQSPAPVAQTFDSYLHEAGEPAPSGSRTRSDLSWWALLEMVPGLPPLPAPWSPRSALIEGQGLALLRTGNRYASLECGPSGGGHGHPDRLNLTLHADGEYWLPDFGTGSYVTRDLFWYRSTLAHNAPRLDGRSQSMGDAVCDNFEVNGDWAWARGRYGELTRTLVAGPAYLVDVLQLSGSDDRLLELPVHLSGRVEVKPAGSWVTAELPDEFVSRVERFIPASPEPIVLRSCGGGDATISVHLAFEGELIRAFALGSPDTIDPVPFYVVRSRGQSLRIVTLLEPSRGEPAVKALQVTEGGIEVDTKSGVERHLGTVEGWEILTAGRAIRLSGPRREPADFKPLVQHDRPLVAEGVALQLMDAPVLDGSLDDFDPSEPLELDHEDQYRRSEEPYPGPEAFSARAFVNWNDEGLYIGIEVVKPEVVPRDSKAPPLRLDNEPDAIHGDGIQVYFRLPGEDAVHGLLIVPSVDRGELIAHPVAGTASGEDTVRGGWRATESGYTLTVGIVPSGWGQFRPGEVMDFDLLVNQMLPGRMRRSGQLVWSGGGGWVWLRGDRQDATRLGTLELR
jgi:hypothetical protein